MSNESLNSHSPEELTKEELEFLAELEALIGDDSE